MRCRSSALGYKIGFIDGLFTGTPGWTPV